MTVGEFLVAHPEYAQTDATLVASAIADAENNVSDVVWGTLRAQGVRLLAAHYLSVSPLGRQARLESERARSTYLERFEELRLSIASGGSVA